MEWLRPGFREDLIAACYLNKANFSDSLWHYIFLISLGIFDSDKQESRKL